MNKTKKRAIYIGAAVVLVLLILWELMSDTATPVETAAAKRSHMTVTVDGEGKTRVREKRIVTAPVAGKMSRIRLVEGDNVPHDYEITVIDPNPPLQRAPDRYDDRPSIYGAKVFAPVSGKVLRIYEKSDGMVAVGTPLVEIGNPENIEIVVDILSTEAVRISPGSPILIDNMADGTPVSARVRLVEAQAITKVSALGVEEQRVNVIGDFLTKNLKFGDNFRIDVRIVVWDADNVLTVPTSALFRSGEDWCVFVVEGGKARRRVMKIGHQNAEEAEVLEGVAEGEKVILHPPNQLQEGASVSQR